VAEKAVLYQTWCDHALGKRLLAVKTAKAVEAAE
jgi:hypothetical protein